MMITAEPIAAKFIVNRLSMWGNHVRDKKCNFEWPVQQMLDQWEPAVALKSIKFKCS